MTKKNDNSAECYVIQNLLFLWLIKTDVPLIELTYVRSGMIPRGGIRRHSRTRRGMHAPRR